MAAYPKRDGIRWAAASVLVALAAGLGAGALAESSGAEGSSGPKGSAGPEGASGPEGSWTGQYVCNQGLTEMTLIISGPPEDLRALYVFYEAAENPGVPSGCYRMSGRYDPSTHALAFTAGDWILQPPGYLTVDLSGTLDPGQGRYSGEVSGWNCSWFDLRRADEPPVDDHPCFQGFARAPDRAPPGRDARESAAAPSVAPSAAAAFGVGQPRR